MRHKLFVLALAVVPAALAQDTTNLPPLTDNPGPSVLTAGLPQLGERSGQQLDFRFYGGVDGVFDNGIQPLITDSQGNLIHVGALYGVEANLGVYGTHSWAHARLGLEYTGSYRHYTENSYFDGSDQVLVARYTLQKSQRLVFDFAPSVGTYTRAFGTTATVATDAGVGALNPALQIFDSRSDFVQGTVSMTYIQSPRTSYTINGNAYYSTQRSSAFASIDGFGASGTVQHRLSLTTTIGALYTFANQRIPAYSLQSDLHSFQGTFDKGLGQHWTFALKGGVLLAEVTSVQQIAIDPVLAALFGLPAIVPVQIYSKHYYPSGSAQLRKDFAHAALSFNYDRATSAGNGLFLTSRTEDANMAFSYSGLRKWNFGLSGGWYSLHSLNLNFGEYAVFQGGLGFTYELFRAVHLKARYDFRQQQIDLASYRHTASRVTIGLTFSPGSVPLSLW